MATPLLHIPTTSNHIIKYVTNLLPMMGSPSKSKDEPDSGTLLSIPHTERTAHEPRENDCHSVKITRIDEINEVIRVFRLEPVLKDDSSSLNFLPGQWLDVYTPATPEAGGFTITSPPSLLHPPSTSSTPLYLELAIQKSSLSASAVYLFQPIPSLLDTELSIRVGGSFIYPPAHSPSIKRLVFVAGGVGVNPLMSMLSHIASEVQEGGDVNFEIKFLYSVRNPSFGDLKKVQFLERIKKEIKTIGSRAELQLFLTGGVQEGGIDNVADFLDTDLNIQQRRINKDNLLQSLGPVDERKDTVCYICGVPGMTDEFIEIVKNAEGVKEKNILFEKWW